MTRAVLTVSPETSLKVVAGLLAEHRISGVPVRAADGEVVGVVSEADILWKELGVRTGSGGLLAGILDSAYGTEKRAAATTAGEAMTAPAITARPDTHVARAAELMIEHGVNRLRSCATAASSESSPVPISSGRTGVPMPRSSARSARTCSCAPSGSIRTRSRWTWSTGR
jgi:signal-transduction protein with cAMP-binding, CBS, and nucleotidyltransferase domain